MSSSTYTLHGEPVTFPDLAAGTAVKNAARRFESSYQIPSEAAFVLAAAMVDPAAERLKVDAKSPTSHLQPIQTPSGKYLLCHQGRVWSPLVSGDGGNGRSRFEIQTHNDTNHRVRPWPIGRHHKPAIIDYHTRSLDDMVAAAKLSAEKILRNTDLINEIAQNPRGVWNPPVVVIARAFVRSENGLCYERWFLHTIEGSTRAEACHKLTGTDAGAPLLRSDEPLVHLRDVHSQLLAGFDTLPTSSHSLAAARGATMPVLIVVAVVEEDGSTPISDHFPEVVSDYVESVHVQPRAFGDDAKYNVLGERYLQKLRDKRWLTDADLDSLLGRDYSVPGKPTVRAATLVRSACDVANEDTLRQFLPIGPGPRTRLTKDRRAKLIGPLVVRQFDRAAESASSALMRPFTPDVLITTNWSVSGQGSEALRTTCLQDAATCNFETPAMIELIARGAPALCAAGLLLSDQGSAVNGDSSLRGDVAKVVEQLARSRAGVNVLADAIAWADGERLEKPRQFDVNGHLKLDDRTGDPLHYPTRAPEGNIAIRALAFNAGEIPNKNKQRENVAQLPKSAEDRYQIDENKLISLLMEVRSLLSAMRQVRDENNQLVIKRLGLKPAEVYKKFPGELMSTYAKYGTDDPWAIDDDELPDDEPEESIDDLSDKSEDTKDREVDE